MSLFDDVPFADGRQAPPAKSGGLFDDVPIASKPGVVEDVARSSVSGAGRGVAGLWGLPGTFQTGVDWAIGQTLGRAENYLTTGSPTPMTSDDVRRLATERMPNRSPIPDPTDIFNVEAAQSVINRAPGMAYKPQTTAGEYAGTLTEFATGLPFTAGTWLQRGAQVVIPALTSETAGQAARRISPDLEGPARMVGALGGAFGTAALQRPTTAQGIFREAMGNVDDAAIMRAQRLMDDAAAQGVRLTVPEAVQQATGGATRLADLQRVVEQSAGGGEVMRPFMAQRAGQVQAAGERATGMLSDLALDPGTTGFRTQSAARAAIAETPEGVALAERVALNAPRTTADDAGAVIQPALRQAYERREGMRSALADGDYAAARNAPANVPLDGGYGVRDVTSFGLRPEPFVDFPVPVPGAPPRANRSASTFEERIDRLADERLARVNAADNAPSTPLDRALSAASAASRSVGDDAASSIVWAMQNGRQDIALTIVERAERAAQQSAGQRPGLPASNPRFAEAEAALRTAAQEAATEAAQLRRLYELRRAELPAATVDTSGPGAAPSRPTGPAPEPLSQFIARNGGIQLDADLAHAGLDKFSVPFAGRVARPDGKSLDGFWREKLIEAGYLRPGPDGSIARNVRDEVIDLLRREQAGGPRTYAAGEAGSVDARAAARVETRNAEILGDARRSFLKELEDGGYSTRGIDQRAVDQAAEALASGRPDYMDVFERAVMARPVDEFVAPATTGRMIPDVQTERMPVVGLRPTQYGQVDARPVVAAIDSILETAKGAPRQALQAARQALARGDGSIDTTVAGLHASREAITDLISQAKQAGAGNSVTQLRDVLGQLDTALEAVPAYGQASRNFAAASRPLEPFGESRVPGQIVQRDQYGRDFTMPREQAPQALERGGASAARDFNEVATPAARQSFENYLTTRILDAATDASGNISADGLMRALRDSEDVVRQFPGVTRRVDEIATARRGLAPVEAGPLGQVAAQNEVLKQARALLPNQPAAGIDRTVSQTVRRVVAKDPDAAQNLVRIYAKTVFDEATQNLQGGPNAFGGAGFAAAIVGNPQQARNLEAAVRALPNGHNRWDGFRRFLDVMEATGQRLPANSSTSANEAIRTQLKQGSPLAEVGNVIRSGGTTVGRRLSDFYEQARLGQNTTKLAEIFTNPAAEGLLRELSRAPVGSAKAQGLALRLTFFGERAANSPNAAGQAGR
ncbi:hypothetical protein [Salinarimonas soli]|uniref:Uncharacterized protein n=1 Tax=Salinarimonas soli TaxID=1638099 RepID=A0A5B2VRC6_9HYPH|nr:hypothetical protein [Salinarimonas soli]KAA2241150.1 hypothetical protein F0L46_04960 [Salinarimonas soli]